MFARLPGKLCFELRSLLAQKNPVSEYCEYSGTGRINSISRGTTRIECMSFNKKLRSSLLHVTYAHGTGLLFFRPDSSQVFPLPAPPNGALSR